MPKGPPAGRLAPMRARSLLGKIPRPSLALLIAAAALVVAVGGGFAYARGGGGEVSGSLTRACVDNGTRVLHFTRVARCPTGSHLISWGTQGDRGPQGARGAQGPKGVTGAAGEVGATGATGAVGARGETGAPGENGATGEAGPEGQVGAIGPQGERGEVGATGAPGEQGERGATGATGARGATGAQGPAGPEGLAGERGPQGAAGVSGFQVVTESASYPTQAGSTTFAWANAHCPPGKELIGGGADESDLSGQLSFSGPLFSEFENKIYNEQWYVGYIVPSNYASTGTITVTALAYCANVD